MARAPTPHTVKAIVNDMAGGRKRMSGLAQWADIDPTGTHGPVAELTRVLALLEGAEEQALTIAELRAHGIGTPGQSIYELQLAGYPIQRVHHHRRASGCPVLAYRLSGHRRHDQPQTGRATRPRRRGAVATPDQDVVDSLYQ